MKGRQSIKTCEEDAMLDGLKRLRDFLGRIIASTDIEATYDPIAYHDCERADQVRFGQPSSLRR
jgi:hypothetical protein